MKTKFLLIAVVVLTTFTGCKTHTVYVPVHQTSTEYRDRFRLDSVYYRDTVQMWNRGDTVFKNVVRWRERFVRDTVNVQKTDSIPFIVEKEVPVNYLTKWQKIRLQTLNAIAALLLIYVAYRVGRKKIF